MRKSEALALYIEDVDVFNKTLTIGKTIAIDEFDNIILQTPKTKTSYRTISLDIETVKIMEKWISILREDMFKLGFNTSKKKQLLFPNLKNDLYYPQIANDWLDWIYKKMKQDNIDIQEITPHGFRHTACSLMFE